MISLRKHPEWQAVEAIAETLNNAGFRAVLAGGCVRDALLGRVATDLDVATDATPDQVEELFEKVIPVGKSFGVCRVIIQGQEIEVATFREESDYQDGRRPECIVYSTLEKDAFRRDFTVNAIFYDLKAKQLIDLVDGEKDIEEKCLRTVGAAKARFSEDYLRILRGVRFAAQLGFDIEANTFSAMKKYAENLQKISKERIQEEFQKAFRCQSPWLFLELCKELNIFSILFDNWQWQFVGKFPTFGVPRWSAWEHITQKFSQKNSLAEGWANLSLHHIRYLTAIEGKATQEAFKDIHHWLGSMKLSKKMIKEVIFYLESGPVFTHSDQLSMSELIKVAKSEAFQASYEFWNKEWMALKGENPFISFWQDFRNKYMPDGKLPEPLITGSDLLNRGVAQGPEIKKKLDEGYRLQVENSLRDKQKILALIL